MSGNRTYGRAAAEMRRRIIRGALPPGVAWDTSRGSCSSGRQRPQESASFYSRHARRWNPFLFVLTAKRQEATEARNLRSYAALAVFVSARDHKAAWDEVCPAYEPIVICAAGSTTY